MTAVCSPVGEKDQKSLVYKGSRFWVYSLNRDTFTSYILTLACRPESWLLIENVYNDGDVVRHWARFGYEFDFDKMSWFKI